MYSISATPQQPLQHITTPLDTRATPASPDEEQARRAAEAAVQHTVRLQLDASRRTAPQLALPAATAAGVGALLPLIAGQHPAMVPGATAEAFATLHRTAALHAAGQDHSAALTAQAQQLIRQVAGDGELVLPSRAEMRALAGDGDGVPPDLAWLHEILEDAPSVRAALDEAAQQADEPQWVSMGSNPRSDFMLMLVTLLMHMSASQHLEAVVMVNLAEQSLKAMTDSMIESAKSIQAEKITGAVVGGLIAAAGVGMAGVGAYKGVQNLRTNKMAADASTAEANRISNQTAVGMNNAPAGPSARPSHLEALRQRPQALQEAAAVHETQYAINNTQLSVVSTAASAVVQSGAGVGNAVASPFAIEAKDHDVNAESNRVYKDVQTDLGSKIKQDANKTGEEQRAMFTTLVAIATDEIDTAKHIVGNMRR